MKKFLIIIISIFFITNAQAVTFAYFENCYLKSATGRDAKIFDGMVKDKFDNLSYEEMYFAVGTDYITKKFVLTDFGLKESEKDHKKKLPDREFKPRRILESTWNVKQSSKNYIVAEKNSNFGSLTGSITLNFKNGEVNQVMDGINLIYQCEIRKLGGKKSNYLDYWWAVILIIAITFFIFTQSGKRLKKIRRK